MDNGWIKLHRKILESPLAKKPAYIWVWIYLLLNANHKPNKILWNKEFITIKEGQFLAGRKRISKETGIKPSTIEDILNLLEKQQQIQQQKTTKFRIITILKWKEYQNPTYKATTKQQQSDTNKKDNNDNNFVFTKRKYEQNKNFANS